MWLIGDIQLIAQINVLNVDYLVSVFIIQGHGRHPLFSRRIVRLTTAHDALVIEEFTRRLRAVFPWRFLLKITYLQRNNLLTTRPIADPPVAQAAATEAVDEAYAEAYDVVHFVFGDEEGLLQFVEGVLVFL